MRANPEYAEACYDLANALFQAGQAAEAIAQGKRALGLQPSNPAIQNRVAWMLATAAPASLRGGPAAVGLALHANAQAGGDNPEVLRTLAAAYAQAGEFPSAVQAIQAAQKLAGAGTDFSLAASLSRELKLYQAGQPYRALP